MAYHIKINGLSGCQSSHTGLKWDWDEWGRPPVCSYVSAEEAEAQRDRILRHFPLENAEVIEGDCDQQGSGWEDYYD